ncbi:MAG: D-tyrosyl-tRNA(Tyr) deacylase [Bacteroidales bacterium]|nr:D-tyrosyl-tRNA(Tyr) deacylase [Bacteroidales bacterium]
MRVVVQRVKQASVQINQQIHASIGQGLLILLGIEHTDEQADIDWLISKIVKLRIFNDEQDKMNLSIQDIKGECLIISQFTLHALVKKGNRPSYIRVALPEKAIPLYEEFIQKMENELPTKVVSGVFGADMKVSLINDGPVTIIMDTKNKE